MESSPEIRAETRLEGNEEAPFVCDAHVFVRKLGVAYAKCSRRSITGLTWEPGETETPQNNVVIEAHREECDGCPLNQDISTTVETN